MDYRVSTGYRDILKTALPIAFAILVPQLNFVVNNIFIGRFLPEGYLGIAAITGVYYLVFAAIGNGLNNGLQALIARRAGENNISAIGALFNNGVLLSFVIAAIGIVFTYAAAPALLRQVLSHTDHAAAAIDFLRIRIWGLPLFYIYQLRNALLVGTNNSRLLISGTVVETLANIFFDYVLINGLWGFPRLGFNGAAYASIIAEAAGLFVIYAIMRLNGLSSRLHLFRHFRWRKPEARLILRQSLPLILQYAISIISWEFFYILIERNHSVTDLAISNSMRNVFGLFGCFGWAFAAASNAMVSNVIGQQKEQEVIPLIKRIMYCSLGFVGCFCLLLNLFPSLFFTVYGQDAAFIEGAVKVTRVVSLGLLMMSIATVWLNAVVGTGNSRINLLTETLAITVYCAYVWFTLEVLHQSIVIGWMSEWLYWTTMFLPSFLYIRSNKWKGRKI
jgi:MATE family multidrug resistance protein